MIAGKQVTLTELRNSDSITLFSWINDPNIVQFSAPYAPVHEANHVSWFENILTDKNRIAFAIRESNEGRILGVIQLIDLHPIHRTAELVVRIGNVTDRGRGFGSDAVSTIIRFGFQHRNLQRIWLRVFADNPRAMQAYLKAGMQKEGVMRRACFIDGAWRDQAIMAALSEAV